MKFKYKKYAPIILRPVIPVELFYKEISIKYEVLIDSGADKCFLDAEIGELLGIEIKKGEKEYLYGITGKGEPYYVHPIKISVGGWPYEIKAGFAYNLSPNGYGVVGQRGFFDIFVIKFDLLKEEIELKKRNFKSKK